MANSVAETEPHEEKFLERKFTIQNKLGLHARPAALFVQTANRFNCEIEVRKGRERVNGKSIMGIMTLAAGQGAKITVRATRPDAVHALEEFSNLFSGNFGEDESAR